MTNIQCKAARALLGWSQDELARKSLVTRGTVCNFERGISTPNTSTLHLIKGALEKAGINLVKGGAILVR